MDMNDNLVQWWIDYMPLDINEKELLLKTRLESCTEDTSFDDDNYFKLIPNCNISQLDHKLHFSKRATDFINELFKRYVDDNTLVITSTDEHNNVKKCVENCKNKIILDYHTEVMDIKLSSVEDELKKYKRVFVYVVGTQISTGEITPQLFFECLKKKLLCSNVEHIMVIDDVHGMFLFPRDYRLFDFIIYTAHALVDDYGMGVLISKKVHNFDFGVGMCDWATQYLEILKVLLTRKEKLFMFRTIMENYFSDLLSMTKITTLTRTTPHIFSMLIDNVSFPSSIREMLNEYKIRVETSNVKTYIRFRAQHYVRKPELLLEGIKKLRFILNEVL